MCTLICLAIVKNACSTLVAFFAEVSRKGIPRLSANSYTRIEVRSPCATRFPISHTFATVYSTTFLSAISLLFPTRSLFTPSVAYRSISWSHCLTWLKESDFGQHVPPSCGRCIRTHIRYVENDADSMGATVVGRGDCSEAFLSGGIPLRSRVSKEHR